MNEDFSEKTKKEVKEKAAFRCCRCQSIGIHVHHILPKEKGGSNEISNAAPLCPSCHDYFGDNPKKRKEITQMRDWWYKTVERSYPTKDINYLLLNDINSKVEALTTNQDKALIDLKATLKDAAIEAIEQMTAGTASSTATGIANASIALPSPEEIEAAGDQWIQSQIDIERGK